MIYIWEELNRFKGNQMANRVREVYNSFPVTKCLNCGRCCWDTPDITYIEFLYAFDFFINQRHSKDDILDLYKRIFRHYMYGPIQEVPCAFLTNDNRCSIHPASPLNCKSWGLQSIDNYKFNLKYADEQNKLCIEYFNTYNITVPRKKVTEYCNEVKVIRYNPRNIDKLLEKSYNAIKTLDQYFSPKRFGYTIHNFFLAAFFKETRLPNDRIRQLKKYQSGDKSAIDSFIESIDFEAKLKTLLAKY